MAEAMRPHTVSKEVVERREAVARVRACGEVRAESWHCSF